MRGLLTASAYASSDSLEAVSRFHTKCGTLRKMIHIPTVNRKAESPSASAWSPVSSPVIAKCLEVQPRSGYFVHLPRQAVKTTTRDWSVIQHVVTNF